MSCTRSGKVSCMLNKRLLRLWWANITSDYIWFTIWTQRECNTKKIERTRKKRSVREREKESAKEQHMDAYSVNRSCFLKGKQNVQESVLTRQRQDETINRFLGIDWFFKCCTSVFFFFFWIRKPRSSSAASFFSSFAVAWRVLSHRNE